MKKEEHNKEILEAALGFHLKGKIVDKKKGTYGIVYIVEQEAVPKYVAYKTIETPEKEIDKEKLKNFVREARQWFKAKGHPLILTPFFITYFRNLPLICMPFCEMDLQTYLEKQKKLKTLEALVFSAQILKALIFARGRGIESHQDLKPGNILLEDLSKKFVDFPSKDVHPSIRFKIMVADFGLANAWKELGKPQGSFPYMAPEQYTPNEYREFHPDIFAVGVILVEMLTGKHPAGEQTRKLWRDWNKRNWEQWAKSGKREIEIGNGCASKELEKIIEKMILPNPYDRPPMDKVLDDIMRIISEINKPTYEQLKLLFEYYDTIAGYMENESRLDALEQLSQVNELLDVVINELFGDFTLIEKCLDNPRQVVYFCELCNTISKLLLKRAKNGDTEKVKQLAMRIISESSKWKEEIKTHHKYPELEFKGITLIGKPLVRDFEVYAELIGYGKNLLEKVIGKEEAKKFFENNDNYTKSAWLYCVASDYHRHGDRAGAIKILDKCIELNPKEASFYYLKALWTDMKLALEEDKLKSEEKRNLKDVILENAKKALQIDPDWSEPKKLYEEYLKMSRE
uniref:Protein kinase domain-containing protein n=1 Tax=candidate division CPR3 bacterium TaxID=2268181 RepID=A0A7C5YUF8_UNCC3